MDIYQSESLTHIMMHVMKLHRRTLHDLTQDVEVYPGQPPLLFRLADEDGQSQNELAQKLRVQPATLTVMITRMEKTGLVERRQDEQDHRLSRVFLTDKGRCAAEVLKETLQTLEQQCFEGFLQEEKLLFRRMLLHMYGNLNRIVQEDR
ncbi:MarR family transcriptional regulator [Paenibacillus sp. UMB4589-SE434]|uniref:MarR family winged helix-turn-helix transcriptional regulator n=1 Tax=Paenibacillus sp. UMB4589-SE434 TaxID=3046314 RepID=UPI00254FD46A|nr:MarR family transcriptional regulator [Paenibacillus sp. UMB4589-SE434]MDK8182791.1 MarR family transcriptional regulator [Paenibacillus sp. UMB4589-SE434]